MTMLEGSDPGALLAIAAAALGGAGVFAVVLLLFLRAERARAGAAAQLARLAELSERAAENQGVLAGRLDQALSATQARIDSLNRRIGDGLVEQTERTGVALQRVHERLAVIDAANAGIALLTSEVGAMSRLFSNKQARGAFGEVQLHDLVASLLPPDAFVWQATLGNGARVDCLLRMPEPPGAICVDAKFPLESYRRLRDAADEDGRSRAARQFGRDVQTHVRDIEAKYILEGETADSALLFLPSEAVYAELHANHPAVVEDAHRRKVWIVSPTTLWATLNTLRGVLRDVRLRARAHQIQAELAALGDDLARLDQRGAAVARRFEQMTDDLRQLRLATERVAARAARIDPTGASSPGGADGDEPAPDAPAA